MLLIYTFGNEEYEYELDTEEMEEACYEWFSKSYNIPLNKAKEIIDNYDLMDTLEEEYEHDKDFIMFAYEKFEEKAQNDWAYSNDAYSFYGVSRNDF